MAKKIINNKSLVSKLMKKSIITETSLLSESEIYNTEIFVPTPIPIFNLFLSGKFKGGISGGHTAIAGAAASFKSMIGLIFMKSYLTYYEDSVCLLYDSEKGITKNYVNSLGIDPNRIIVKPFPTLESLKNDLVNMLDTIERGEHVFILIDSISNAGSLKELEDTLDDKNTKDLTRSQVIKSIFRLATSMSSFKDIPIVSINHIYTTLDKYKPDEIGGGSGIKYSANTTWKISKLKNKDESLDAVDFKIKIEKSRHIIEGINFLLTVPRKQSIKRYSGLFELALEYGFITSPTQGWYEVNALADYGKVRRKEIEHNEDFWKRIFEETNFFETIEEAVTVSQSQSSIFNDIDNEIKENCDDSDSINSEDVINEVE